jgi:non-heme chloroperoxidase
MAGKRILVLTAAVLCLSAVQMPCTAKAASSTQPKDSVTEGTATTPAGISIHYLQAGNRQAARALVLIPGWRLPAYLWNRQLREFSPTIRVVAIDPRSQGASTKASKGNSPEVRAKDLHEVLAVLGVSTPVLMGWSQGAQDVAAYVQQYGNGSVAGIVLVDSPVSIGASEVKEHPVFAQIILAGVAMYMSDPEGYSRNMVRSLFKQSHPDLDMEAIVKATLQTPVDTGAAMLVADIFGADRRPGLAKLNKPALVIAASSSPLLDLQKEMAAGIPGARFLAIDEANHAVFVDQPERFDEAVKGFLVGLGH